MPHPRLAPLVAVLLTGTACYPFILDPFRDADDPFETEDTAAPPDTGDPGELCTGCFDPLWLTLDATLPIDGALRRTFFVEGTVFGFVTLTLYDRAYFEEEDHEATCSLFYVAQDPIEEASWAEPQGRWFGVQLDDRWVLDPGSTCLEETFDPAVIAPELFPLFPEWGYSFSLDPLNEGATAGLVSLVGQEVYDAEYAPYLIGAGHSTVAPDTGYVEEKFTWIYEVDGETIVVDGDDANVRIPNEGVNRDYLPRALYVTNSIYVVDGADRIFAP